MTEVTPFDLRLAGNEVHHTTSILGKITEQTAQRLQHHMCSLFNQNATVTPEITLEHDRLHANHDEDHYRNWVVINEDVNDLLIARVSRSFTSSLTDLSCGGRGVPIPRKPSERSLASEDRLLNMLFRHLLDELSFAYNALTPTSLRLASEKESTKTEHYQHHPPTFLSCMNFHLRAGSAKGTISILYPTNQHVTNGNSGNRQHGTEQLAALKQRLLDVSLRVSVRLSRHQTTLKSMLELEAGDMIPIETTEAEFLVAGKPIGTGEVLTDNDDVLLEVISTVAPQGNVDVH